VRAQGQVIASSRTQVAQAANDGVVQKFEVREGRQQVRKGQLLVMLERNQAGAAYGDSTGKVAALKANLIRLRAEVFSRPLVFPADVRRHPVFVENQTQLSTRRQQAELSTQEQLLSERSTTLERTEIRAPADRLVRRIQVSTLGARARAGDTVLELLPTGGNLVVEATLKPADRAFIREGLAATVKLDACDYAVYGSLHGRVTYVGPDALSEQTRTADHIDYQVHVTLDPPPPEPVPAPPAAPGMQAAIPGLELLGGLSSGRKPQPSALAIQPGMTTTVEIRPGSQTVLKYLTKPVTKTLNESLTER
jgi:multidrug efflux pump subunit AcrA (membrane-fusion protein)